MNNADLKGDGINRARVVRDRPYWAVIDQRRVHARYPSKREARRLARRLNRETAVPA